MSITTIEDNPELDSIILKADLSEAKEEQLGQWTIHILKKKKAERTEKDIQVLKQYTKGIEFFKNIIENEDGGHETHHTLCENLEYEFLERDQCLFEAGSAGTKFYIILGGMVDVVINLMKKDDMGFEKMTPTKVASIPAGKAFGELAIMEESVKPRKATINSNPNHDCHFATLSRAVFQATLSHIRKQHEESMAIFMSNPVFNKLMWSKRTIDQLMGSFHPLKNVKRATPIYQEGDKAKSLYWIRKGEVVCSKTVEIPIEPNLHKEYILDEKNQMYHLGQQPIVRTCEICYWSEGQLFGEEEAMKQWDQERDKENERIRLRKLFIKLFEDERRKKAREGFSYRPTQGVVLPKNAEEEKKVIEQMIDKEIKGKFPDNVNRLTNVTVSSSTAEIWMCKNKNFFPIILHNQPALEKFVEMIETKQARRLERTQELVKNTVGNIDYLKKTIVTKIDKDFAKLIKKNKAGKVHRDEKVILESNQKNYNSIKQALEFIEEGRNLRCLPDSDLAQKKVDHAAVLKRDSIMKKSLLFTDSARRMTQQVLEKRGTKILAEDGGTESPDFYLKPIPFNKGASMNYSQLSEFDLDMSPTKSPQKGGPSINESLNFDQLPAPIRRTTKDYERRQTRDHSPSIVRRGGDSSMEGTHFQYDTLSKSALVTPQQIAMARGAHRPSKQNSMNYSPMLKHNITESEMAASISKQNAKGYDYKKPVKELPSLNMSLLSQNYPNKEDQHTYRKGKKMIEDALEAKCKPNKAISDATRISSILDGIPDIRKKFNLQIGNKTLIVNNPLKGLSYTTNMNTNLHKYTEQALGTKNRISSKAETEIDFDGERFMRKQLQLKGSVKNRLLRGNNIKNDFQNPLFDIKELKASHEELMEDINELKKMSTLEKIQAGNEDDRNFLKSLVQSRSRDFLKEGNLNSARNRTNSQTTPRDMSPRQSPYSHSPVSKTQPGSPHEQVYRSKVHSVTRKNSIHTNPEESIPEGMYMGSGPQTPPKATPRKHSNSPVRQLNLQRLVMRRVSANDVHSNISSPRDFSLQSKRMSEKSRNVSGFSPAKRKEIEQQHYENKARAALFKDEIVPYNMRMMANKYQRAKALFNNILDTDSRRDDVQSTNPTTTLNPNPSRPFFSHLGVSSQNNSVMDFSENGTQGPQQTNAGDLTGRGGVSNIAPSDIDMPDHSNRIANMLDNQNNKFEKPIIATQGFYPKHKALVKGDNNIYNRMVQVEKAEVMARRNKLPTIVKRRKVPKFKPKVYSYNQVEGGNNTPYGTQQQVQRTK